MDNEKTDGGVAIESTPWLDEIRDEAQSWQDLADIENGPLGGNVVKAATYRGTATGLKMAEQIIMQYLSNVAITSARTKTTGFDLAKQACESYERQIGKLTEVQRYDFRRGFEMGHRHGADGEGGET